jgi:(E)-4-hydroxy-3-methylbut-2-enyl-diphosphate synthase
MAQRLKTPVVEIGSVKVGGDNPVVIQSMTNTDTADAKATALQAAELARAGSEIVRMTVNDQFAAQAVPKIRELLDRSGFKDLPLVGDFHYNGHILLSEYPDMARILDKYRINPGNVGFGDKHDYNFSEIIKIAIANDKAVRIGVNWGSLDQDLLTEMMDKNAALKEPKDDRAVIIEAMVESAMRSADLAVQLGLSNNKIILSVKMSELPDVVKAYRLLAERMIKEQKMYALHLGLTEAGTGLQGVVSSSAALAILLNEGIGDTIRVSITPGADVPRTEEVEVCKQLLQALHLKSFKPKVVSCPGCGRAKNSFFQELAALVNKKIEQKLPEWQEKYPGCEKLNISVMGCVVNGPGEAKYADFAISLPGKMEKEVAPVYIAGKFFKSLTGANIADQFIEVIEDELTNRR